MMASSELLRSSPGGWVDSQQLHLAFIRTEERDNSIVKETKKLYSTIFYHEKLGGQTWSDYFPMQNSLKILSSRSSLAVSPVISPSALYAARRSIDTKSKGSPCSREARDA